MKQKLFVVGILSVLAVTSMVFFIKLAETVFAVSTNDSTVTLIALPYNNEVYDWSNNYQERTVNCNLDEDKKCGECQTLPTEGSLRKKCCASGERCLVITQTNCTTGDGRPC